MATNIDKFVEPSEIPPSATGIPIGAVIPWWPDNAGTPPTPPSGFEYCDGTAVTTPGSVYLGQTKPDLMVTPSGGNQGFSRGGNATVPMGPAVPLVTGGSDTHGHSTSTSGAHSHSLNNHTHVMGGHSHSISGEVLTHSIGAGSTVNNFSPLAQVNNHASHSHGGFTGGMNPASPSTGTPSNNNTDGEPDHGHTVNGSGGPPFHTELAMIVRVI